MQTVLARQLSARTQTLANAGIGLVLLFAAGSVAMHFVQPGLSPVDDAVSYYMNGRLGWVLGLGLVAIGTGSLCIAFGLHSLLAAEGSRFGSLLLALWGVGAIIGGIFPPDPRGHWDRPPSLSGLIHGGVSMVALLAFPAASWLLSRRIANFPAKFGQTRHLAALASLSAVSLGAFLVCLAPVFAHRAPRALGLVERVLLIIYMAWIVAAGLRVRYAATAKY